ncbi:hypothetical protein VINI7043_15754 [Vibrio nigripulchritudo ATCC 27043]|uniref:NAD(P)-binding protein n=1 Tax=Vibrio nigripulchritudo TaxID=28173 RepID=UPI00021C2AE2|nr:NAD(P)-binding protein [Vibrio nigripulchritudo]EGU50091.1 hypothetical protein VINI7043_15754 [Vibrio nigripulchritudo ATCC 27043]
MTLKAFKEHESVKVGIIGGGIAGSTSALKLSEMGLDVSLFEKRDSLVSGPPICHLHAGGNLYREISEAQCIELLRQSIDTVKLYRHTINIRPTVLAVPNSDSGSATEILPRLNAIKAYYQSLVNQDPTNKVLGEPESYFVEYSKGKLLSLKDKSQPKEPVTFDDWMIPFAQHTDLEQIKFPVIAVQEFGWSVFRLSSTVDLALESSSHCKVFLETEVQSVKQTNTGWELAYVHRNESKPEVVEVDYLINASGYETGTVDDWVNKPKQRLVEFKAAYVTRWEECRQLWPEVIFHGPRATPAGMAQLTPYANGVFQLHGMTESITLFDDGLVASTEKSSQPELPNYLSNKIKHGWTVEQQSERTNRAIQHMSKFIPSFSGAKSEGKPLFGAQQVPGNDVTLRAADVSFEGSNYARMEIVKGSSALEAADRIARHMAEQGFVGRGEQSFNWQILDGIEESDVVGRAVELAKMRQYPDELALIAGVSKPI